MILANLALNWLPSKLLLKHFSSIPLIRHATDSHPSIGDSNAPFRDICGAN